MYLIQIFLPLSTNQHAAFPQRLFVQVRQELVEKFGGLTAYLRSPASGLWKDTPYHAVKDDIVIYEIMSARLERRWWAKYRAQLTARFQQHELVVRAMKMQLL